MAATPERFNEPLHRIHKPRERSEKVAVIGIRERGGNVYAAVTESIGGLALRDAIKNNVLIGSRVISDEAPDTSD